VLRQIAKAIRHHPMLEGAEGLWSVLRKPYHLALGLGGRGTKVSIGGSDKVTIRIPPDLSGWSVEDYEPENVDALSRWIRRHPGGLFVDVGCSIGFFSAAAMFLDPAARLIAIDGDLESVAATRRFCRYAPTPSRLTTIHGLVTDDAPSCSLADAASQTDTRLAASGAWGRWQSIKVAQLDSASEESPRYRLDDLVGAASWPTLIKCDVEGAELLVLKGAYRLLAEARCDLLLSVHPWHGMKERYGNTVEDVRTFLEHLGYQIEVLAVSYEEHWWCTPQ
jgi:FkbM family methyltransferase